MGKLAMLGGLMMVRLPEKWLEFLYGERETFRDHTIDAKALALGRLANTVRIPGQLPTVAESREQSQKTAIMFDRKGPKLARVEDFDVDGAVGKIVARLYSDNPDKTSPLPALVYYHGGGFIQGNLDSHHEVCTKLAKWSGGIVVAIDYRLAPEHPFPAGVDDARQAFVWLAKNAASLGIDAERMGVGGDSAGACFAAVVAADLATHNNKPEFQVLIYPVLDGHLNTASINELENAYVLPKERMVWYRDLYAADFDDFTDPRFSPVFTENFASLPKTYLITGGFDPLCDDGITYAQKLTAAKVPLRHRHFPGQIHAFVNLTGVIPEGTRALAEIADWLRHNW